VAQAFASLAVLSPGRVFLGVGSGEALNEVPSGGGWDDAPGRLDRMIEAVRMIRQLWTGEWVRTHSGQSDQLRVIGFYAQEVLPRLRALTRAD
jgi:alkanesulfonate monooxygenase SsuD/methylene tetrahydromethanopterin reductase-like flavin-dependent oxidoreductase (luciferase family)